MAAACVVPALVIVGPALAPGFVLRYDMVFTPRQPLLPESVGLGSALPRAVPADAVVALATTVVPGDLLQKAVLLLTVWAAAYGMARLAPGAPLVAATFYTWSAYVAERLLIGHWSVLVAYACLPWVFAAGLKVRRGEPGGWPALVLACAPAALVPTGGVLAAGVAVAAAGMRRAPLTLALAVGLNAPWWLPGLLHGAAGNGASDPAAVDAFAARGEGPGGAVVSVLGLGGIWNADAVPAGRGGLLVPLVALLLVAAGGYGLWRLTATWGRAPVVALAGLAAAGVVLAVAATVPGPDAVLRWLVAEVPGAGLLRDGQKWVAWWALAASLGCAMTAQTLISRSWTLLHRFRCTSVQDRGGWLASAILVGAALLPVALLPGLAWGVGGQLEPVRYPRDWYTVRAELARDPHRGDVLVLPFQPFRQFGWNDRRTQLDPAPRFLTRSAVVDDTLVVGDEALRGEDQRAAQVGAAIGDPGRLARLGIGWVLVEYGTPGTVEPAELAGLTRVHDGRWLALYRVPGPISEPPAGVTGHAAARATVLAADAAAALAVLVAFGAWLRRRLPASTFMSVAGSGTT
ncbi:hypothetical protein Voc01_035100 [Virgisporangium ochraceum]|uniref:Transmembrane protein n=1 Tax=Virgisporangium ochraceum TaxID=65505 RepID=A0A8J4EBL4_9ACTN|nr:hypothetical protein Voc01_035100 [Virgisporangium ochraceum]